MKTITLQRGWSRSAFSWPRHHHPDSPLSSCLPWGVHKHSQRGQCRAREPRNTWQWPPRGRGWGRLQCWIGNPRPVMIILHFSQYVTKVTKDFYVWENAWPQLCDKNVGKEEAESQWVHIAIKGEFLEVEDAQNETVIQYVPNTSFLPLWLSRWASDSRCRLWRSFAECLSVRPQPFVHRLPSLPGVPNCQLQAKVNLIDVKTRRLKTN